jgi:hypothetical protein
VKKQSFRVTVRVDCEVVGGVKNCRPLTEARVKSQVEKFLKDRKIMEGLPYYGTSQIRVTDVIEDTPKEG